ncbi:MAG: leucine-rich repeat domain-containing protein, partial [Bacteroidaceae bacterium]|nr:leucine-rich repeat domain-containing protein [Bacteroidaceae bacterium]
MLMLFLFCKNLTSITIPDSVTSIDGYAFSGCSALTFITIPNSISVISDGCFRSS